MNAYLLQLKQQIGKYHTQSEYAPSAFDMLWEYYLSENSPQDAWVTDAEHALAPIHQALSMEDSDALTDLLVRLTVAYQRSAFLDGIRIGMSLQEELSPSHSK